uniref:AMP-dependent synthetase/ligase domain-containing protein n=1 Tax=Ditylenchus dipsaci TaxID=166011 RepID=A0A915D313_9BILA
MASSDEICYQIEAVESTHCIVESQFASKIEDARRNKTPIKALSYCKTIKLLDDVLGDTCRATAKRGSTQFLSPNLKKRNSDTSKLSNNFLKESELSSEEDNISATTESMCAFSSLATPLIIFFAYSGISSTSKPMVITHQTLIRNLKQISSTIFESGFESKNTRLLLPISIHHIFGAISTFYSLISGSFLFTLSKYSPEAFFEAMLHNQISHVHCTTTMVQALALEVNHLSFPSLHSIVVGGARFDSIAARTCKTKLNVLYITTEIGSICTFSHSKCQKVESVGIPLPGLFFKITNLENNKVCNKPHQLGHLLVSRLSPQVFNNRKATQELYTEEGFVKTGEKLVPFTTTKRSSNIHDKTLGIEA